MIGAWATVNQRSHAARQEISKEDDEMEADDINVTDIVAMEANILWH